MAKQTFTTGQVLLASQLTNLQQTSMLGGSASIKTVSYTLVAADAGSTVAMNSASSTTITVNQNLFSAGDIVTIYNTNTGVSTITAGTATVTTSGSLALSQNQGGVLHFTSASAAIFFQFATPASGDIEGVTAGTGISGGGTSGTVTITNSMATAIDAKGDLVAGTGADAFSRLAVGSNDTVLTADSSEATGLKWAAPASGGMTLLSTTTLSSTTTTVNITPTGYVYLYFTINKISFTGGGTPLLIRLNGQTGSNYCYNNRTRDNVFSKGSGQSSISSVNDYDNSDAQFAQGVITLPNATNQRPNAQILYYYNSAANQGFGQSWGAFESSQAAITSITFFSSNGTSTFANSPQLLIYGVK